MTEVETPPGRSQRRLTARGIGSDGQRRKATREGLYKGVGESTYLEKSKEGGLWRREEEEGVKSTSNRSTVPQKGAGGRCRNMENIAAEYYLLVMSGLQQHQLRVLKQKLLHLGAKLAPL